MRILGAVVVVMLLTGPAYTQTPHVNLFPDKAKSAEEKEADAVRDKAYKELLKKIPDAKTSSDPWGNVRSADTPKTQAPARRRTNGTAN